MTRRSTEEQDRLLRERTNLRMIIAAVVVGGAGLALLYISGRDEWWKHRQAGQTFISQLGALLLAAVALAALWEFAGKRSFAREILSKVGVGSDIERAGVVRITDQYLKEVEWDSYFEGIEKLDIVVAYGRTWRRTHWDQLKRMAQRSDTRIRIILPDPDDTQSLSVLADRFNRTPAQLRDDILESATEFIELKGSNPSSKVHLYLRRGDHVFSCYRLDRIAVVTFYSHSRTRKPVPTIVCQSGGSLYDFIYDEIKVMLDNSREILDRSELEP
jgi:hypothetical protein